MCTTSNCDIQLEIFKYLKYRNIFNKNVEFQLSSGGVIVDSLNLMDFIYLNSLNKEKADDYRSDPKPADSEALISVLDASLNCQNDPDYTCQEWDENLEIARLRFFLNSTTIGVIVDQDLLNSNVNILTWVANFILATPISRLITALAALGRITVYEIIITSTAAATISDQLSKIISEHGLLSLEVGDLILYLGNGDVVIIKGGINGNGSSNGGSDTGTGSNTIVVGGSGNTGNSRRVCTGSNGEMVCYTVYY